jgi:pyridoxal phosphate enzyme (YggS family)
MPDVAQRIADNAARVRAAIADAASRCGRRPEDITLIAVTKYVGVPEAAALLAAGCHDLGESRPQELWSKAEALAGQPVRWHMIGHLQRNKVRRTLPATALLHAGDSLRLLAAVDEWSREAQRITPVLLEVNISGDATKHGFAPEAVEPLLPELSRFAHLQIRGLMAMSRWGGSLDEAREDFRRVRELRDRLAAACPPQITLVELSLGMSSDFTAAIAEGATLVRIGSALFEGLIA